MLVELVCVGPQLAREQLPEMCWRPWEQFPRAPLAGQSARSRGFCGACHPATGSPAHPSPITGSSLVGGGAEGGLNTGSSAHKRSQRAALDIAELAGSRPCSLRTMLATEHFSLPALVFCKSFLEAEPEHLWKAGP